MLNFNHDSKIKFFLLSLREYTLVQPKIEGDIYVYSLGLKGDICVYNQSV